MFIQSCMTQFLLKRNLKSAKYFEFIATQCLRHNNCIGYTWYQYSDIVLPEGTVNRGIVDSDGNPYPELYESMKKVNSNAELLQQ